MRYKFIGSALVGMFLALSVSAQTKMEVSSLPVHVTQWVRKHFSRGTNPPFSFKYGGKSSSAFITKWRYSSKIQPCKEKDVQIYVYTYVDPVTSLRVDCEVKAFPVYQAIEWVLHFTNGGTQNSRQISDVKVNDITFNCNKSNGYTLHYPEGSHASKTDFSPHAVYLKAGESFKMRPEGGRSSQMMMPFFNIETDTHQGIMTAIGWTGTWYAHFNCINGHALNLATGIERLDSYLLPGEKIRTSSICMLFWHGDNRMIGHNQFRRFILAHHTWKVDGKPTVYPVSSSFNYGDPAPCNEYTCLDADYAIAMVKRYKQFKLVPEVFWLDAGWYKNSADIEHHKNWANTVGSWEVDSMRFPDGLKPIADEIHKVGAKFMVWFEPERVMKGSDWAVQHQEWMLDARGKVKQEDWTKDGEHDSYLFNLGNTEACRWMSKYIGDFIEQNGIDYYRQDFNIEPEGFWYANDEPGRKGICEIKYIEGLYKFWEYLLNRFPGLLVDNCASGGRRLDLETISRSAPMWRTDYQYGEPIGYQCHTYGLCQYLPLHGTGTVKEDKFTFRSSLGTSIIYNWKITQPGYNIMDMRARQAEFNELRPYFYEDFYPLSGTDNIDLTQDSIWLAYQLHRSSDQSGYVVAFRRKDNSSKTYSVKLSALKNDMVYTITNKDTGEVFKQTGRQLKAGLTLNLSDPERSLILKYEAMK